MTEGRWPGRKYSQVPTVFYSRVWDPIRGVKYRSLGDWIRIKLEAGGWTWVRVADISYFTVLSDEEPEIADD